MSSSLTDIRNALATTLNGLGLQVYSTVVDVVNTPACVIDMAQQTSIDYTSAMHMGGDMYHFELLIFVANTDTKNTYAILDQYVTGKGAKSVRQTLFSGIGLADVDAMAISVRGYGGSPKIAGIEMIGAIMRVVVTVT